MKTSRPIVVLGLLLALVTLACFAPAVRCDFVNYDDPDYFSANPHVQAGLTLQGVKWAFTTDQLASRYPLTWLSFMFDAQLFGPGPAGPHLTNLLLHVANTVLVFLLLQWLTGARWRSALVAILFALHPLRVESVAWISERKGVLSTLFWLLSLWAYTKSVKAAIPPAGAAEAAGSELISTPVVQPARPWYWLSVVLFACGLLSKPIVVTLPFVLLLFDYWPLERFRFATFRVQPAILLRLVGEKVPFLVLAAVSCAVTYLVHENAGAVVTLASLPLGVRIENALVSYARYLGKTIWPTDLALPYPRPAHVAWSEVVLAAIVVAGLSAAAFGSARRRPYLLVGWLWFLGTLVPVIGLVQWGDQAIADRFSYVPAIGLCLMAVWAAAEALAQWRVPPVWLGAAAALLLALCEACTLSQLRYWTNSVTLFNHSYDVTRRNYVACLQLGSALDDAGKPDAALPLFSEAVSIAPRFAEAQYNLGRVLLEKGRLEEAIRHLNMALALNPRFASAHTELGAALMRKGELAEAATNLFTAVQLKPDDPDAHYNLATLWLLESKLDAAIGEFAEAIRLKPNYAKAQGNLGVALMRAGRATEGVARLEEAVRLAPADAEAHFNLGVALLDQGRAEAAVKQFSEALRLRPGEAKTHYHLALALARLRRSKEAIPEFREALRLQPDNPAALNDLAWLLASDPDPALRAGSEAVQLAEKACELTQHRLPALETTLAAAYAEAGRFKEAAATAEKARDLALAAGQKEVAARAAQVLSLAQSNRPYRETL